MSPNRSDSRPNLSIEALGLRKVFGHKVAVDSVNLAVEAGEVFGFLGPNGAGKSTVVKMLMGLVRPTAGTARLLGRPLGDLAVKERIGFLPEHFRFHEWLRADEFLDFHGRLYGMPAPLRQQRAREVLELVGLAARATDKLRTYSKGMLQRVGIAQALLNNPQLVFLDEPTSALDPLGRREVRDVIRILKARGVTVFLNSHLLSEIEMVCDRVAIIDRGRIVREGLLAELLEHQHQVEIHAENLGAELMAEIRRRYQVLQAQDSRIVLAVEGPEAVPAVAELMVRSGARLYQLTLRHTSLEELFVQVVKGRTDL